MKPHNNVCQEIFRLKIITEIDSSIWLPNWRSLQINLGVSITNFLSLWGEKFLGHQKRLWSLYPSLCVTIRVVNNFRHNFQWTDLKTLISRPFDNVVALGYKFVRDGTGLQDGWSIAPLFTVFSLSAVTLVYWRPSLSSRPPNSWIIIIYVDFLPGKPDYTQMEINEWIWWGKLKLLYTATDGCLSSAYSKVVMKQLFGLFSMVLDLFLRYLLKIIHNFFRELMMRDLSRWRSEVKTEECIERQT